MVGVGPTASRRPTASQTPSAGNTVDRVLHRRGQRYQPESVEPGDSAACRDSNDRLVVSELLDWISSGAGAAEARVFRLYGTSTPAFQARLLDGLARSASDDCPYSLSVLLALIDEHRLARPAIVRTGIADADLDDAEQATLLAVARSIHRFRGESRFTTWLYRLARNTAIGEVRRRKPTADLDDPALRPAPGHSLRRMSSVVAESHMIESMIAGLPDAYRATVHLRDVERLSYQEIAEREGVSVNTVKSRLNRGRQLLAKQWADGTAPSSGADN